MEPAGTSSVMSLTAWTAPNRLVRTVSLSPQTVYFGDLLQGGWGVSAAWNPAQVLELHWQVTSIAATASSQSFTICIDDVSLVP
jgi:hypothetical protein